MIWTYLSYDATGTLTNQIFKVVLLLSFFRSTVNIICGRYIDLLNILKLITIWNLSLYRIEIWWRILASDWNVSFDTNLIAHLFNVFKLGFIIFCLYTRIWKKISPTVFNQSNLRFKWSSFLLTLNYRNILFVNWLQLLINLIFFNLNFICFIQSTGRVSF